MQARAPRRGIETDATVDHSTEGIAGGRDSEQQPDVGRARAPSTTSDYIGRIVEAASALMNRKVKSILAL